MSSDPLDPPRPLPPHLWPPRTSLGPDDLRLTPSTRELRVIAQLLDHEHLAGFTMLTMRDGSPWLEVDVAVPAHGESRDHVRPEVVGPLPEPVDRVAGLATPGVYRFAIWRYTAKAYRCDEHGAVDDDPIDFDDS